MNYDSFIDSLDNFSSDSSESSDSIDSSDSEGILKIVDYLDNLDENKPEKKIIIDECLDRGVSLAEITFFECGLGFIENNNVNYLKWKFNFINEPINVLTEHKNFKVFDTIKDLFRRLFGYPYFSFKAFIKLCNSDECDETTRDIIIKFLTLGIRGFNEIGKTDLAKEIEKTIDNYSTKRFFSEDEILIFFKIGRLLSNINYKSMKVHGDY